MTSLSKYIAKIWGSMMKEEGDFVASLGINNPKFTGRSVTLMIDTRLPS